MDVSAVHGFQGTISIEFQNIEEIVVWLTFRNKTAFE